MHAPPRRRRAGEAGPSRLGPAERARRERTRVSLSGDDLIHAMDDLAFAGRHPLGDRFSC